MPRPPPRPSPPVTPGPAQQKTKYESCHFLPGATKKVIRPTPRKLRTSQESFDKLSSLDIIDSNFNILTDDRLDLLPLVSFICHDHEHFQQRKKKWSQERFSKYLQLCIYWVLPPPYRGDTEYKYHGKRFTQSPSLSRDQNMGPSGPRLCQIFRRSFSQLQSILVRSGQNQHIIDAIINYQN